MIDTQTQPAVRGPVFNTEIDGIAYVGVTLDDLRAVGVAPAAILDLVKGRLKAAVDAKAEAIRSAITTPGTGQAMEYQEAQAQAFAALSSPASASAERFPMLAASVDIDIDPTTGKPATDVLGVARSVRAAYDLWLAAGAAIRGARLAGKKAIDDAETDQAAAEAYTAIAWPTFG